MKSKPSVLVSKLVDTLDGRAIKVLSTTLALGSACRERVTYEEIFESAGFDLCVLTLQCADEKDWNWVLSLAIDLIEPAPKMAKDPEMLAILECARDFLAGKVKASALDGGILFHVPRLNDGRESTKLRKYACVSVAMAASMAHDNGPELRANAMIGAMNAILAARATNKRVRQRQPAIMRRVLKESRR